MRNPKLEALREDARALPLRPGVYLMKDASGRVIYVGKAKALRNRVSSYFRSVEKHTPKTYQMVEQVRHFDTIITDNEYEALTLEASLIKQYNPKYNILLKDGKGYRYIRISHEPYPRITAEKQKPQGDDADYLGPYTSAFAVKLAVEEAIESFLLPTCRRKFPRDFGKQRPCLNRDMGRCMGVCTGKISEEEYRAVIDEAVEFLKSGNMQSVEALTARMEAYSENLQFELAARIRDRIRAIEKITERQKVVTEDKRDIDVVAMVQGLVTSCFVVLGFRHGRLYDKEEFVIDTPEDLPQGYHEFLMMYYTTRPDYPDLVYTAELPAEPELLERFLSDRRGKRVQIHKPQRGTGVELVEMARSNASETLAREVRGNRAAGGREIAALDELRHLLGLVGPPGYIEAYDISNLGDRDIVGGMVVFENGKPLRKAYKRFRIQSTGGVDDYGSMREMLARRLQRYLDHPDTGDGFGRLPDLILLDGGKGHVAVIRQLLDGMGIEVPVFGMVKDDRHRTRAIAKDGGEIAINSTRGAFTLVSNIQEEVHRYAIEYQRLRRKKTAFQSVLQQAPGIGPKRAAELMQYFKRVAAIKAATVDELAAVPGMSRSAAEELRAYLDREG